MEKTLNYTEKLVVVAISLLYFLLVGITFSLVKYFYDDTYTYIILGIIMAIFIYTIINTKNLSTDFLIKIENSRGIAFHMLFLVISMTIGIIEMYRYIFMPGIFYILIMAVIIFLVTFTSYNAISYNNSIRKIIFEGTNDKNE